MLSTNVYWIKAKGIGFDLMHCLLFWQSWDDEERICMSNCYCSSILMWGIWLENKKFICKMVAKVINVLCPFFRFCINLFLGENSYDVHFYAWSRLWKHMDHIGKDQATTLLQ